jgi:hypothetical protein
MQIFNPVSNCKFKVIPEAASKAPPHSENRHARLDHCMNNSFAFRFHQCYNRVTPLVKTVSQVVRPVGLHSSKIFGAAFAWIAPSHLNHPEVKNLQR